MENAKIEKFKCDIMSNFQVMCSILKTMFLIKLQGKSISNDTDLLLCRFSVHVEYKRGQ